MANKKVLKAIFLSSGFNKIDSLNKAIVVGIKQKHYYSYI